MRDELNARGFTCRRWALLRSNWKRGTRGTLPIISGGNGASAAGNECRGSVFRPHQGVEQSERRRRHRRRQQNSDAHLGNIAFDHRPAMAIRHYDVGLRIGELSFGENFDGLLPWEWIDNRPFLRCMNGLGLCLWRLGRFEEAQKIFKHALAESLRQSRSAVSDRQCLRWGAMGTLQLSAVTPDAAALRLNAVSKSETDASSLRMRRRPQIAKRGQAQARSALIGQKIYKLATNLRQMPLTTPPTIASEAGQRRLRVWSAPTDGATSVCC
jgi:hypothetical protein